MLPRRIAALLVGLVGLTLSYSLLAAAEPAPASGEGAAKSPWAIDFRYSPPWWQTSICLPDDWQKTLVGKEGQLLYDFSGRFHGFKTSITLAPEGPAEWVRQELVTPRTPVVRTVKLQGTIEIVEEAFAVAPPLEAEKTDKPAVLVERTDSGGANANWANPSVPCDPAFRNIAVAMNGSVEYRVAVPKGGSRQIVLGLCEGWWKEPGKRPLQLKIEGAPAKTVDLVKEFGQNVPAVFPFAGRDENGDGWIDVTVVAVPGAQDQNTILNLLWVFDHEPPPAAELIAGLANRRALACVECASTASAKHPPRHDVLLAHFHNTGTQEAKVTPTVILESETPVAVEPGKRQVSLGSGRMLTATLPFEAGETTKGRTVLKFEPLTLPAGKEQVLALGIVQGQGGPLPADAAQALALREKAEKYWHDLDLPYGVLQVPDPGVQALVDSSIRNIYQAREIKKGLPAFQVGPTCYRGLWVVDGSFLMESVALLGRDQEARSGIRYLLSFQRDDGAIMIMDGHWKETGITLWAVARHARLTGDREWLAEVWPKVERGFQYIRKMRTEAAPHATAPNYRLIPVGFSDGGLGGKYPEYTNVYWTLVGMKAAIEAARWLDKTDQATQWQAEYDDFYATFRKAAERDAQTDAHGNRFVPIRMKDDQHVAGQKAQWGFMHAVFPGKVFAADDPLVVGNMAMLRANECEGMVYGTGWITEGVWNYFGSFYAHGWLWLGQGQKAAETLYHFGNHASPLLVWREEQSPQGKGTAICGDMPHNWASAEFIRLVRHLLVLERGDELHLLEGLPAAWVRPGAVTRINRGLTDFGPIGLELRVSDDGAKASLRLDPPQRTRPKKIVLHLEGFTGKAATRELSPTEPTQLEIPLR